MFSFSFSPATTLQPPLGQILILVLQPSVVWSTLAHPQPYLLYVPILILFLDCSCSALSTWTLQPSYLIVRLPIANFEWTPTPDIQPTTVADSLKVCKWPPVVTNCSSCKSLRKTSGPVLAYKTCSYTQVRRRTTQHVFLADHRTTHACLF